MKIYHIHIQGFYNPETGIRDGVDTGGQTRFVHETCLAQAQEGHNVTVITRKMQAQLSGTVESEISCQNYSENGSLPYRVCRIQFGDSATFIRKEDMYSMSFIIASSIMTQLGEELKESNVLVSHYADGGLITQYLKEGIMKEFSKSIPHIHIPHSIGYAKFRGLIDVLPHEKNAKLKAVSDILSERYNFLKRISVQKYLYQNSDLVIHTSEDQVKLAASHPYYANSPTAVISPGYNRHIFKPSNLGRAERVKALSQLGFADVKEEDFIVCLAARFVPEKGFSNLIQSLPHVMKKNSNTRVLMIGGNSKNHNDELLRQSLQLQAEEALGYNASRIIWHEGMPQEEFAKVVCNVDVFTSLRRNQPFGMAPLQALASGTNIVVEKTTGIAKVLPKKYTTTCDASDPHDLSKAILEAGSKENTSSLMHVQQNYSWGKVGRKIFELLEKIRSVKTHYVPKLEQLVSENMATLLETEGYRILDQQII